jgi:ubiquinone biosynthesis protein
MAHQTGSDLSLIDSFVAVLRPVDGRKPTVAVMRKRAIGLLKEAKSRGTLEDTVRQVVLITGIEDLLPDSYSRFRSVVVEGMVFMISALPLTRLAEKVVDQIRLNPTATLGQRLYALIKDMPSLQKLGQIICRSPGLDPQFKKALIDLEDNIKTVTYRQMRPLLMREIRLLSPQHSITPEKRILAEATVCAVVPAEISKDRGKTPLKAVLKAVKPAVRKNMSAELAMLDRLMEFLDMRQGAWDLGDFNFTGTLKQVRKLLENEVNLVSEQRNLDVVKAYYGSDATVAVPEKLPASTPKMTVMTRIDGTKITDVNHLTQKERRRLVSSLAKICILRPIQDMREESIFHGDPHAGNISYTFEGAQPRIIFYDWGMLGRLKRLERFTMALLTLGLIMGNKKLIFYTADIITRRQTSINKAVSENIMGIIDEAIAGQKDRVRGLLSSIEFLFEKFTYQGVVFSADLLMYEKALLTLKGVLADVDPSFNRDDYMIWAAMTTFLDDVVRLRVLKLLIKDAWTLYRHSLSVMFDLQKVIGWFLLDVGRFWRKLPKP